MVCVKPGTPDDVVEQHVYFNNHSLDVWSEGGYTPSPLRTYGAVWTEGYIEGQPYTFCTLVWEIVYYKGRANDWQWDPAHIHLGCTSDFPTGGQLYGSQTLSKVTTNFYGMSDSPPPGLDFLGLRGTGRFVVQVPGHYDDWLALNGSATWQAAEASYRLELPMVSYSGLGVAPFYEAYGEPYYALIGRECRFPYGSGPIARSLAFSHDVGGPPTQLHVFTNDNIQFDLQVSGYSSTWMSSPYTVGYSNSTWPNAAVFNLDEHVYAHDQVNIRALSG